MVYDDFVKMVAEQLDRDVAEIKETTTLQDLGADSLDVMDLGMDVKQKWGVEIKREDMNNLVTIKDYVDYINNNQ